MPERQPRRPLVNTTIGAILVGVVVSLIALGFEYGLFQRPATEANRRASGGQPSTSPAPAPPSTSADPFHKDSPPQETKKATPVRWTRLVLVVPAGFQHGTVQVNGSPARVLDRLPNFIDIQVPDTGEPVAVRVEGRGRVCEKTVLATSESAHVSICPEGY